MQNLRHFRLRKLFERTNVFKLLKDSITSLTIFVKKKGAGFPPQPKGWGFQPEDLMKRQALLFFLLLLPAITFADLNITVTPNRGWGNAPTSNIKKLCENVALHFQEQLRAEYKIDGELTIVYSASSPVTFYRRVFGGGPNDYKIGLTVTGTDWSKFSYQFGHEFCHVMLNHNETHPNNPNDWFYEAICELANVWVLRRMGETWAYRAPYPNWTGWRHNLTNYANNSVMGRADSQYAGTGAEWLEEWEKRMRQDEPGVFNYQRVAQLTYKFLPIFEENPEAWNAVRQISDSKGKMAEFMQDWYAKVDTQDKQFVEAIAKEMGISVESVVTVSIDADVNNDGYVDLSDVLIVRSAIRNSVSYGTDINNDGTTDEIDVLIVKAKAHAAIAAAAPAAAQRKIKLTTWGELKRR